jgi:cytoskeleton protein RodZ
MDKSVGQVLHDARTRRGLDLTEVERVTKIRVKFLRAMEEDRWEALPAPVYARSFLSTYAHFLGLEDEPLIEKYEGTADGADRAESIPLGAIKSGGIRQQRRPLKPVLIGVGGLAAVLLLGLAIVGLVGGSGGGGAEDKHAEPKQAQSRAPATTTTPATGSELSLELRSTAEVWVCLVGAGDRALVTETLPAGATRGPFEGRSFEVTFGNGAVDMTVDGEPAHVPPLAEPLGYRITTAGVHRLDSASRPTCT